RAERCDQTLLLHARFWRERFQDKSAWTDHQICQLELLRLARKFLVRISCRAQGWFPIRIALGFFKQQTPAGLPISNRAIINSPRRRGRAIFIGDLEFQLRVVQNSPSIPAQSKAASAARTNSLPVG